MTSIVEMWSFVPDLQDIVSRDQEGYRMVSPLITRKTGCRHCPCGCPLGQKSFFSRL